MVICTMVYKVWDIKNQGIGNRDINMACDVWDILAPPSNEDYVVHKVWDIKIEINMTSNDM